MCAVVVTLKIPSYPRGPWGTDTQNQTATSFNVRVELSFGFLLRGNTSATQLFITELSMDTMYKPNLYLVETLIYVVLSAICSQWSASRCEASKFPHRLICSIKQCKQTLLCLKSCNQSECSSVHFLFNSKKIEIMWCFVFPVVFFSVTGRLCVSCWDSM